MLKVGLISAWHVHAEGYADLLRKSENVKIAAVWDEDPIRGEKWAKSLGATWISDYDKFLAEGDFTAVVCNSPTTMHLELLSKAAKAKKHIFTEKLLATNVAECEQLCKAILDNGVIFTVSLPVRMASYVLYVRKLIEDGVLGRVTGGRFRRSHSGVSDNWLPEYWYDVSKTGGGAMMDLGAHPVYVLSFLLGEPKRIAGLTSNIYGTTSDENAIGLIEFEDGVIATAETAFVTYGVPDILEIYGTSGSVFVRGGEVQVVTKVAAELGISSYTPAANAMPAVREEPLLQFVEACINNSGTPEFLGTRDALVMTKIIEAIYQSDETGVTVTL